MDSLYGTITTESGVTMVIRRKQIVADVEKLLAENNIHTPPVPVEDVAKRCGLQIRYERLESDLSGFVTGPEHGAIIGVNTAHPVVRRRFTIAHELGHFRLHRDAKLHVDRGFLMKRSALSSQGMDEDEIEANLYAAELLMPRSMLSTDPDIVEGIDVTDEKVIGILARRYLVSAQALVIRLLNLGLIDQ